ncbi:ABC transporter substrate-binding protein [Phreatobacter sp. AB_2022a]|uniref:ABC transporter substrate-binding protein n=1 Tax=Phreatobacter sp. AB_2022a TaxID=3003134 RepID=UPI002286DCC5|nr:ABC transporter substrate-binding protein [Phreatobacter sp. AB_2022a]MCZ0733065.1 ABC transporter substrate-binding protein [Phreatobacter sp. AB_2022a]
MPPFLSRLGLAGALLVLAHVAPAAAESQAPIPLPEAIRSAGVIRVGIEATYPPMAYKDPATNERRGLNVDLVTAIAKELNVTIQWEEMTFEQLITGINAGRVDFSGSSMTDLPARREKLSFVDYIATGPQIFTTSRQSGGIATPLDMCGKTIATPRTTNYFPTAQAWSETHCVAAGRPPMQVIGTAGAAASRADLQQGRANAALLGAEYVAYLRQQDPGTFVAIGAPIARNLSGLAFPRSNPGLRDAVAAALKRLVANGTYLALLKKHGLEAQALTEITIDAGQ